MGGPPMMNQQQGGMMQQPPPMQQQSMMMQQPQPSMQQQQQPCMQPPAAYQQQANTIGRVGVDSVSTSLAFETARCLAVDFGVWPAQQKLMWLGRSTQLLSICTHAATLSAAATTVPATPSSNAAVTAGNEFVRSISSVSTVVCLKCIAVQQSFGSALAKRKVSMSRARIGTWLNGQSEQDNATSGLNARTQAQCSCFVSLPFIQHTIKIKMSTDWLKMHWKLYNDMILDVSGCFSLS
eukprot:4950924-Amphidinium_carterae.1